MKKALNKLTLAVLASCLALPAVAQQTANTNTQEADNTEVIQVRGIRGSLTQALATKRMSASVLDSVSAEDIGDFPDKNIGDALQRISGVTVSRTYGEVDGVNIRGTAPEHSLLLLNGQNVATVGWFDNDPFTRSFNFEMVSAEQVAGMDVYKSTEAQINEGAMGGTINLKTRKPLEMDAFTVFGSVEASHNTNSDGWEPNVSGLVSWKDENEKFGILVAHSVEKNNVARETQSTFGGAISWDGVNKPAVPDSDGNFPVTPLGFASILFEEQRERTSSQVSLQFQATDQLLFSADYNRFELDNPHINTAIFNFMHVNGIVDAETAVYNEQGVLVAAHSRAKDLDAYAVPLFNNTVVRTPNMVSDVINLNMDYSADNWDLTAVVGKSTAKSRGRQSSVWFGDTENKQNSGVTWDIRDIHKFTPDNPSSLLNHDAMKLFMEFSYLNNVRDHEIDYYQVDHEYQLDNLGFTSVESGIKYQEQKFSAQQENMHDGLLAKAEADGLSMGSFNGGTVSGILSEVSDSSTLTNFAVINDKVLEYGEANKSAMTIDKYFVIQEDITSAYVKGNFETGKFRGNVGLRWVDTDVASNNATLSQSVGYSNLLPSLNVVYNIQDDILLRFATSKSVSRPQYEQMKMASKIEVFQKTASIGNPDIKPYESTQFDLGIEWYFNDSSLLSATYFSKDITDYIESTSEVESIEGCQGCIVTRFRNAGEATVNGIEMQYQQDFGNGFGLVANYTYTDSELDSVTTGKGPLYGVSENSYNLSTYYEDELISARIAYNARDEWRQNYNGQEGTAEPFNSIDASLIWHVNDKIDISVEGVNILNEVRQLYRPELGYMHSVDQFGARFFIGASYRM
ncbi:TonB-dependent receptor [Paraglaciecola arctica]|uniref:TonB-dependent receptor n=1 Tax=Paraglaciecola arctica BSs20135 TaxID=493475 RepID=K6YWR9_9ALTE|nr:TonB-dependent receptor [Paraglaciecola arctica]GAC21183.1 TonB-dependent receptor [Paraglaciecola arctica BSs20135]